MIIQLQPSPCNTTLEQSLLSPEPLQQFSRTPTNGHLSTMSTSLQWPFVFYQQSIHSLLFQPLYKGHFLLSLRWPLQRGSTVLLLLHSRLQKQKGKLETKYILQLILGLLQGIYWSASGQYFPLSLGCLPFDRKIRLGC